MRVNSFNDIPSSFITKWQEIADLIATLINVPAALIMKTEDEFMEVFISSNSENNPYNAGDKEDWHGLYCETVIKTQNKLHVPNAIKDKDWDKNPDIKLGMIAYLGIPLNLPNSQPFGTLCVLDSKETHFTTTSEKLLNQFKNVIEIDLALIQSLDWSKRYEDYDIIHRLVEQNEEYSTVNEELQQTNIQLLDEKERVVESEKHFRLLVENAPYAIFIQTEGKFSYVNNAAINLYGASSDYQLINTPVLNRIHPDFRDNVKQRIKTLNEQYQPVSNISYQHLRMDNTPIDVEVSAVPFKFQRINGALVFVNDISDRKKLHQQVIEHGQNLENIFTNSPVGIFVIDIDKNGNYSINSVNPAHENLTGLKSENVKEQPLDVLSQLFGDEVYNYVKALYDKIVASKNTFSFEEEIMLNNKLVQVNTTIKPLINENGVVYRLIGTNLDISKLKETEKKLIEAKEKTEESERHIKEKNEEYEALNEELREANENLSIAKEKAEESERHIKEKNEEYEALNEELREANEQLSEANEKVEENHKALLHSHYLMQYIIEHNKSAVAVHDKELRYLYVSKKYLDDYNVKENNIIGKHHYEVFPDLPKKWRDVHEKALQGYTSSAEDDPYHKEDGTIEWTRWECRPWHEVNGEIGGFIVYTEVVTERKEFELELLKAKEKAEERERHIKEKNEEYEALNEELREANEHLSIAKVKAEDGNRLKTAFLHNMSHEIRTPLNAIVGFSERMSSKSINEEKRNIYTNIIIESSYQLLNIVSDILTISSLDTSQEDVQVNETDLNKILGDLTLQFQKPVQKKSVTLNLQLEQNNNNLIIQTDKYKLIQILNNLLSNAIKFTHSGKIDIGFIEKNDTIEFFVSDTGIGIDAEKHEAIFDRFVQADTSIHTDYGGTGLGLSICKGYVEMLGGKIWVESELGKGSTFRFSLPINIMGEKVQINSRIKPPTSKNKIIKVLVVEDQEFNFVYIEEFLLDHNCEVIHAWDGKQAIDLCKENSDIDLVLMDIKMPILDGFSATKFIREIRPNLPVIAQTAYATADEIIKFSEVFDEYITKPFSEAKLQQIFNQFVRR
jgi:PAS domain S-box-containing protein